jgi:hypothetical protein
MPLTNLAQQPAEYICSPAPSIPVLLCMMMGCLLLLRLTARCTCLKGYTGDMRWAGLLRAGEQHVFGWQVRVAASL